MIYRTAALCIALTLSTASSANDANRHVVGIHRAAIQFSFPPKLYEASANGICLNENCSIIVTAYHTQLLVGRGNLSVTGASTKKVLSLANEQDTNKASLQVGNRTVSYDLSHDIAFIYTKRSVPRRVSPPFSFTCAAGQRVTIAGYINHKFVTKEARVIGVNVPLLMGQGHLNENLVIDTPLSPGMSGSAVFDEQGNLLGMVTLTGTMRIGTTESPASIALPIRKIAMALIKLDPSLGSSIFTTIPDPPPELDRSELVPYQESDPPEDISPVIPRFDVVATDVPDAVRKLKVQWEAASKSLVNFIAKQCLVQGTEKPVCHEVSVVEGEQTFREIRRNGRLGQVLRKFPPQNHGVWGGSDWLDDLGSLKEQPWAFEGVVAPWYLFSLKSTGDDCYFEEHFRAVPLFGGEEASWEGPVRCRQWILSDENFNVVTVFTELLPPDQCLTQLVQKAIYYEWVTLTGLQTPVLLPTRERIVAKVQGQRSLWYAQISWSNYERFRAEHTIEFPSSTRSFR